MSRNRPLDALDRGLVQALRIDARAPFSRVAAVLGTSTQTLTRRYARLRAEAGLHVLGLPYPQGEACLIRLTTAGRATELAETLAERPGTAWVQIASGGTEINALVYTTPPEFVLGDLPASTEVTAVSAHYLLRTYLGGPNAWRASTRVLTEDQERQLRPPPVRPRYVVLGEADRRLFDVLLEDGRTPYGELAVATGWSAATVAKRLTDLRTRGALFFDVEVDDAPTQALLWLSVAPAQLDEVAEALAEHEESTVVAATTGRTNLVVNLCCPDASGLHEYLSRRLAFDAIVAVETTPVLSTVKALGPVRYRSAESVDK
ncbi:Lrp/AsnC family transcriptional regulator [Kribbella deserti]|uniref:Lrp/AsnC family transcriptional regulator n=1 Tax=Kribbella deserti TaxID=1926257 RepID=A0ABV6QSL1_9ACTN